MLFITGNQKSGTSAIASLLGRAASLPVSIDFQREMYDPKFHHVRAGKMSFQSFMRRNALDLNSGIVKEPNLAVLLPLLLREYPDEKVYVVTRHPLHNIRSICDRLGCRSDERAIEVAKRQNPAWKIIASGQDLNCEGGSISEVLAQRWLAIYTEALSFRRDIKLIRYEDFVSDKQKFLDSMCNELELSSCAIKDQELSKQFQPRGRNADDLEGWFEPRDLQSCWSHTSDIARSLGYDQCL